MDKIRVIQKGHGDCPLDDWRWISGRLHIAFKPEYEQYFDVTQGPLSYFLRYDKYGWNVNSGTVTAIFNALDEFRDECRNGHFHKDNIDKFEEVSRIRHNAIAVCVYLLGGYNIDFLPDKALTLLDAGHEKYLRFFHEMRKTPNRARRFEMHFKDGKTVIAQRCWNPIVPKYDESGTPTSEILFTILDGLEITRFEEPPENIYPERALVISRDNCPSAVWRLSPNGKRRII